MDNRPLVNLASYAMNNIANYQTITELPQEHIDYLNSVRGTDMTAMFGSYGGACYKLTSLDVSKWDTSNVTDMTGMFWTCWALTTIIGAIDMSSCNNCISMFIYCYNLKGVHLKNVPRRLNLSDIGGTEGTTYIVDNYID